MSEINDYARQFDPDVYDKSYYEGDGSKSGYTSYENTKGIVEDQFKIIERVMQLPVGTHLDVGCAYGFGCNLMMQKGWKSNGVDVSEYAIGKGKELFPDLNLWVGDAAQETAYRDLSDKSIDLVTSIELFEHVESRDVPNVLKEMQRIAKNGLFVVNAATAPKDSDWNAIEHDGDHGHLNHHNLSWWITEVAKVGELDWERMFAFSKTAEKEHPDVHWHNRVIVVKFYEIPTSEEQVDYSDKLDEVIEKESEGVKDGEISSL